MDMEENHVGAIIDRPQDVELSTYEKKKNMGMGFALCLCNTKAKLAIKQNDK